MDRGVSGKLSQRPWQRRDVKVSHTLILPAHSDTIVHILSATPEHQQAATTHITSESSGTPSQLHSHTIYLGDLSSLISLTSSLSKDLSRLDMLQIIAGIAVSPYGLTKDGLGNHFAVNNLSQIVLVDGLLKKMKKTSE